MVARCFYFSYEVQDSEVVGELIKSHRRRSLGVVVSLKADCFSSCVEFLDGDAGWVDGFGDIKRSVVVVQIGLDMVDKIQIGKRISSTEATDWSGIVKGTV